MNHKNVLDAIESVGAGTAVVIVHFRKGCEYRVEIATGETIQRPALIGGYDDSEWDMYMNDMRQNLKWGSVSLVIANGERVHATKKDGVVMEKT